MVKNLRRLPRPQAWRNDQHLNTNGQFFAEQNSLFPAALGQFRVECTEVAVLRVGPSFAVAYDCAEHLDGSSRKQVLAIVQMIEIARLLVGAALERECPVA